MDGDSSDDQLTHHSNDSSDDAPSSSKWNHVEIIPSSIVHVVGTLN